MEPRMPPGRLARWSASALLPLAIAVPVAPVLLSIPARAAAAADPGAASATSGFVGAGLDPFLVQTIGIQSVLLVVTLAGALLVRARMRRAGDPVVTRHESWAVLALAIGGAVAAVGFGLTASGAAIGATSLVDGMWTVVVAAGALIVLPVRELRRMGRQERTEP